MTRKLRDIEIEEISLVDKAATGRKFMIIKSAEVIILKEIADLIEEFSDEVFDETFSREDFEKKDISQKVKDALKEALEAINKYREDLPSDLKSGIDLLLKFVAVSYGLPGKETPGKKEIKKRQVRYWPSFDFEGEGEDEVEKFNKRAEEKQEWTRITEQLFGTKEED